MNKYLLFPVSESGSFFNAADDEAALTITGRAIFEYYNLYRVIPVSSPIWEIAQLYAMGEEKDARDYFVKAMGKYNLTKDEFICKCKQFGWLNERQLYSFFNE